MNDLGAENVVTIEVPPEANFCDHMVIASTKSLRHMKALHAELLWVVCYNIFSFTKIIIKSEI